MHNNLKTGMNSIVKSETILPAMTSITTITFIHSHVIQDHSSS